MYVSHGGHGEGTPIPIPPRGEGVDTLMAALNEQSNYSSPSGEAGWGVVSCSDAEDGITDQSTIVKKTGTYTIDEPNKTIELTDSEGNKFMRLSNIEFGTGSMTTTVLFYDLNQTYNIGLNRTVSL